LALDLDPPKCVTPEPPPPAPAPGCPRSVLLYCRRAELLQCAEIFWLGALKKLRF
jgi:hypothetical protein